MKKLKVFIAEDDVFISEELKAILLDLDYEVVGIGHDYDSSVFILKNNEADIALLDIKMHGMDQGFEIASFIKEDINIPIVFLTSFSDQETVEKAVFYDPKGYIVKPFNQSDIFTTLAVVRKRIESVDRPILIKSGREHFTVPFAEIMYVKSDDKYIEVHTITERHVERESLQNFLDRLRSNDFIQVHRSYAVNRNYISGVTSDSVTIKKTEIPLSRTYKNALKSALGIQ
jgi:DNA-binding LytR/AlgR family response regulator